MNISDKDYMFSVKDYLNEIIYQKKILIYILISALSIGSLLFIFHKEKYQVSLNIGKIKNVNMSSISLLKDYEEMMPFDREYLREIFIEELLDRNEIINALNYYKDNRYKQNLENVDLKKESNKFFIKKKLEADNIDSENIENRDLYILTVKTDNLTDINLIFKKFMEDTNISSKQHIVSNVEKFAYYYDKKRITKIAEIEGRIDFKKEEFLQSLRDKLTVLEREYEIALNLEIENSIIDQYTNIGSEGNQQLNANKETYLEGYKILDKRINIIKKQIAEKIIPTNEQLRELNLDLVSYKEDDLSNRIIEDYKNSGFLDNDLMLVEYDIDKIKIEKNNISKREIFIITIMLGIISCFIFSLFSVWVRKSV